MYVLLAYLASVEHQISLTFKSFEYISYLCDDYDYNHFSWCILSDFYDESFMHIYVIIIFSSWVAFCREYGLLSSATNSDEAEICAVCLERACTLAAEGLLFLPNNAVCFIFFVKNYCMRSFSMIVYQLNCFLRRHEIKLCYYYIGTSVFIYL